MTRVLSPRRAAAGSLDGLAARQVEGDGFAEADGLERAARIGAGETAGPERWAVDGGAVLLTIDGGDGLAVQVQFRAGRAEVHLRGQASILRSALCALALRGQGAGP